MDKAQILDILCAYELGHIESAEPLDFPFRPWRVAADQGEFVIRHCRLNCSPKDLQFEHALTEWLAERGIPLSLPVRTADGTTWVETNGQFFAVYRYLPGTPFTSGNARQAASAGEVLARFHAVASGFQGARSRELPSGFQGARSRELPSTLQTPQRYARTIRERWGHRPETEGLIGDFDRLDRAVSDLCLEEALLHNDFTPGNCVFAGDEIAGLFDLDCCYWGPRILDAANSLLHFSFVETGQEGVEEHQDEFDLTCAESFLRGYEAVHPLPADEKKSLALILRWRVRCWALYDLAEIAERGPWRDWEWRHSKSQIALIDGVCERLPSG